jgi:outer membrane protein TolC
MYRLSKSKLILLFTLIYSSLFGETKTPLSIDQNQAISLALSNNKSLNAARTTIEQARAKYKQTGKLENPEVILGYSTDQAFNNEGESALEIGLEQRFPITNRLRLLKNIAEVEISLAETEILNQERLLAMETADTVLELVYIKAQLKLRESLIELNQRFASFIDSRIQTGEASSIEVNQVKIELYSVKQEVQQLRNRRMEQLSILKRILGLEDQVIIQIDKSLVLPDSFAELSAFSQEMLEQHPEYRLKDLLYRIADEQISLAMTERWGDIGLGLHFSNEKGVDEPEGLGTDRFFGVSISIPLPLNNSYRGAIEEKRSYKHQIKNEIEAISLNIHGEAELLRQKATSLYSQAYEYNKNLNRLVDQNLEDMNTAYSAGQISLTDLFRSQEQRLKIQSTYLSMVHEFERALNAWKATTGINLNN